MGFKSKNKGEEGARAEPFPKKSLGQNFLRDKAILQKIADSAQIKKNDVVVEIGPGEGTLTEFLIERAGKVIAVEKDEKLAEMLEEKFREQISNGKLEIISADILSYEIRVTKYELVGNIPYYITGALFKKFLAAKNQPKSMTFLIQKEVAERITSKDGKESILSISVKAYGEPHLEGIVKAGSFHPRPKVDSAVISVRNISKERFIEKGVEESEFFNILRAGFAHKRKVLSRNLEILAERKSIKAAFEKYGIPINARAEDLSVEDWFNLVCFIHKA